MDIRLMICLDTPFLIDLWRNKGAQDHPTVVLLNRLRGETFAVPSHAVGEFLEGAACVSEERFRDAIRFVRLFGIGAVGLETAEHYARVVSDLRSRSLLSSTSKPDMWIAAWAVEHGSALATRNQKQFKNVPGLRLLAY